MQLGYPRPATPGTLARNLRQLADRLEDEGDKALWRAQTYAARGYPTATIGADGGRTSTTNTSTERAALDPDPFAGIDERFTKQLVVLGAVTMRIHDVLDVIMTHADDHDPIPPGSGPCLVHQCQHICNPKKNSNDRLRAGLCPAHYKRLTRMDPRPERDWFITHIGVEFT